ncbi:MAG: NifB/NifX family molybdenum-iron cluster-binding protein [bacterium]|jgi:predicted Fe-Mo cluster-binding NifX family protein
MMKVAVTAQGQDMEALVDPRFGRCQYFLFVDTETMQAEAVKNPAREAGGGAGIQAGQLVADRGAEAVITGDVGPNASRVLIGAGMKVYTGAAGTVREAVQNFQSGKLTQSTGSTVPGHSGM